MAHFGSTRLVLLSVILLAPVLPREAPAQSLRGSPSSVDRMYYHAADHGIYFYKTGAGIREAAKEGRLVRLSGGTDYVVRGASYPYVKGATRTFVENLSRQYRRACGERLVITSAARPKAMRLLNSVAKSVHPTGMAVDLRKPDRKSCRTWLQKTLLELEDRGVLEATEEHRPPHFHVAIYPTPYTRYVQGKGGTRPTYALESRSNGRYRVRSGDSLWEIARRHDTTVGRLKAANGLNSSRLKIGQLLVIP